MYNLTMSQINEILVKNLSYIEKYNSTLCDKIKSISQLSQQIEMIYTRKNEPNLALNGTPINEQSGALLEAERIVNSLTHNNKNSIHIVFGTGFGYLLLETVKTSNGTVILYEPNIELLRVALEMVDMSEALEKSNVFITDNLQTLEEIFYKNFLLDAKTALLASYYHKTCLKKELEQLIERLKTLHCIATSNTRQRTKYGFGYTYGVLNNLPELSGCTPIHALKDSLKNIPAIIAAAGPSLGENIETIKQNRDKFVLFGVSSSLATLFKYGITPDFVSLIERFDATSLVKNYGIENTCLIAEPYVNKNILNLPFKNKFITSSIENPANRIYEKSFSLTNENFETKGTVAYNALFAAKYLGCNPIILAGQDLAYLNGECYSQNSPMSEIKCRKNKDKWEVYINDYEKLKSNLFGHKETDADVIKTDFEQKVNNLNEQLVTVKSVDGTDIPTSQVFAIFCEYYKSFAKQYSNKIDLYNLSKNGADIGNFKQADLLTLMKNLPKLPKEENTYHPVFEVRLNYEFINNEINLLLNAREEINKVLPDFNTLKIHVEENNLTRETLITLKELINSTMSILNTYKNTSILFNEITNQLQNILFTLFQDLNSINLESIKKIYDALSQFYLTDIKRINWILKLLSQAKRSIK